MNGAESVQGSPRPWNSGAFAQNEERARAIILVFAIAAMAIGGFAATSTDRGLVAAGATMFFFVAAMVIPLPRITPVLVLLIPLQFYYPLAGSFNLRGAWVFAAGALVRVLFRRLVSRNLRFWNAWLIPAGLFVLLALISALGAPNRYAAFKGIYDWLGVFACAFVVSEIGTDEILVKRAGRAIAAVGLLEGVLGLIQTNLKVSEVADILRVPLSQAFYQPNLLRDRLADMSFNWILFDRVLPFGTFINGIDYALFLATVLAFVLGSLIGSWSWRQMVGWVICALLIGSALLLTFKGSGLIALTGAALGLVLTYLPRLSSRVLAVSGLVLVAGLLVAVPYSDLILQRVTFLVQREAGALSATGRFAIWAQLLAILPQRPLFGFGLENAGTLIGPLPSLNGGAFVFNFPTAESAYVAALLETGIMGFAALSSFILVVIIKAYQRAQTSPTPPFHNGIFAALLATFFGNLTVVGLTTDQNGMLLGVLIGLVFAQSATGSRQRVSPPENP